MPIDRMHRLLFGVVAALLASFLEPASAAAEVATYQSGVNGPGTRTVEDQLTQQSSTEVADLITDRINDAVGGGAGTGLASLSDQRGRAAGSAPRNDGLWLRASGVDIHASQLGANYHGPIVDLVGGLDTWFSSRTLMGVSAGYEHADITTIFNGGKVTDNGFELGAYTAYWISHDLSFDAHVEHTWANYHESHGVVTGHTNGDRWSGAIDLNARQADDAHWRFMESLGYFGVTETQDAYVESNANIVNTSTSRLNQIRLRGRIGYLETTNWGYWMPYASTRFEFDIAKSKGLFIDGLGTTVDNGDFGTRFAIGADAAVGDNTTFNVELNTTQFKKHFESEGISGTLRVKF